MNDATSAPFAHIPYVQNPYIPPKISKNPQFWQISRNSPTIFRFEQREMEPSKFTANYAKIAQSATPSHESREKSHQSLLPNATPAFCSKFREIRSLRKDSERLTQNNPFRTNSNKYSSLFFRLS